MRFSIGTRRKRARVTHQPHTSIMPMPPQYIFYTQGTLRELTHIPSCLIAIIAHYLGEPWWCSGACRDQRQTLLAGEDVHSAICERAGKCMLCEYDAESAADVTYHCFNCPTLSSSGKKC